LSTQAQGGKSPFLAEATLSYAFTRLINDEYSEEEKSQLLRAMWSVAFAEFEQNRD
jgi:uncharacterized tellurite resistance protein B-like protein